jgi:hypothetical protein
MLTILLDIPSPKPLLSLRSCFDAPPCTQAVQRQPAGVHPPLSRAPGGALLGDSVAKVLHLPRLGKT